MGDIVGHPFHGNQWDQAMQVLGMSKKLVSQTRDKMKADEHLVLATGHRTIAAYHRHEADKFQGKKDVYRKAGAADTDIGRKALAKYEDFSKREKVHEVAYRNHIAAAHLHELHATRAKDRSVPAWHTDNNLTVVNSTPIDKPTRMAEHALRSDERVIRVAGQPVVPLYKRRKRKSRVA
jgi:hypothetical protein